MKVTNTSNVEMRVRGVDGVVSIAAGRTAHVQFTEEQLARARGRSFLEIERLDEGTVPAVKSSLAAKHRGGGSYSVMDGSKEVLSGLSRDDAEAFNRFSEEDKVAYVANLSR